MGAIANTDVLPEETNPVNGFLAQLYEATLMDEHLAVDKIFDFMDEQLLAGHFSVCDQTLAVVDPARLLPSAVVSLLMVTLRAKNELPSRTRFLSRGFKAIAGKEGLAEAEVLLGKHRQTYFDM
jgi:hypothetical protein